YKNLARLYDAELRSARSGAERSTALTDHAILKAVSGEASSAIQAELVRALEHEPKAEPALLLECYRRAAHDAEGTVQAVEQRAESCDDPQHRGALLLELSALREARGDIDGALAALREAALAPEPIDEFYAIELARFARDHGF